MTDTRPPARFARHRLTDDELRRMKVAAARRGFTLEDFLTTVLRGVIEQDEAAAKMVQV